MQECPLSVQVAETINQDHRGWFWSAQITISGENAETLSLRSQEYFETRFDAAAHLEATRPSFLEKISTALSEIGLWAPAPPEKLH